MSVVRSAVIVKDSGSVFVGQMGPSCRVIAVHLLSVHSRFSMPNIVVMKDGHRSKCPGEPWVDHIHEEEDTSLLDGAFGMVDMACWNWANVVAAVVDFHSHSEMDWVRQDVVDEYIVVEAVLESGETNASFRALDPLMMSRAA